MEEENQSLDQFHPSESRIQQMKLTSRSPDIAVRHSSEVSNCLDRLMSSYGRCRMDEAEEGQCEKKVSKLEGLGKSTRKQDSIIRPSSPNPMESWVATTINLKDEASRSVLCSRTTDVNSVSLTEDAREQPIE